jgi:hypothetical protein
MKGTATHCECLSSGNSGRFGSPGFRLGGMAAGKRRQAPCFYGWIPAKKCSKKIQKSVDTQSPVWDSGGTHGNNNSNKT